MKTAIRFSCLIMMLFLAFQLSGRDLTSASSDYFAGSGVCALCHTGFLDAVEDVSIVED